MVKWTITHITLSSYDVSHRFNTNDDTTTLRSPSFTLPSSNQKRQRSDSIINNNRNCSLLNTFFLNFRQIWKLESDCFFFLMTSLFIGLSSFSSLSTLGPSHLLFSNCFILQLSSCDFSSHASFFYQESFEKRLTVKRRFSFTLLRIISLIGFWQAIWRPDIHPQRTLI